MKNKNCLIITLGHNSSALFFDGQKAYGYEQERLDKIKSSSAFPRDAIERLVSEHDMTGASIFVSHWYDNFSLGEVNDKKHLDMEYLTDLAGKYDMQIFGLREDFTHHDAHAYSSLAFMLDNMKTSNLERFEGDLVHFIVADGFGNKQETVSIYSCSIQAILNLPNPFLSLVYRSYGYHNSLGLMYQYATSFCGMKENQDEYKFLGYESHIQEVLSEHSMRRLEDFSDWKAKNMVESILSVGTVQISSDYINLEDLKEAREEWNMTFIKLLDVMDVRVESAFTKRVIIGHFIQNVLEIVMSEIIRRFGIKNVCLSGGLFYNVKLNNHILKEVPGVMSVIPLAGDQGAGIGFYQRYVGRFRFGDMCYGKRDKFDRMNLIVLSDRYSDYSENIFVYDNLDSAVNMLAFLVTSNNIVNFVEGNMEFGPRALCHTSTLALPSSENVDKINRMNKRNTVMPMAPVMLEKELDFFFDKRLFDRVIGSDRYMIVTYDYKLTGDFLKDYRGVMHKYPTRNSFSGRPQVVSEDEDKVVRHLLQKINHRDNCKCLINTSYNVHGNPILFDYKSILEDFKFQCDMADSENMERPHLVLYVR